MCTLTNASAESKRNALPNVVFERERAKNSRRHTSAGNVRVMLMADTAQLSQTRDAFLLKLYESVHRRFEQLPQTSDPHNLSRAIHRIFTTMTS